MGVTEEVGDTLGVGVCVCVFEGDDVMEGVGVTLGVLVPVEVALGIIYARDM